MTHIDPMKDRKPGEAPPHRVPIFDHKGNMRGHVGRRATPATVSRFLGQHGAKLGTKNGRDAWIGPKPPPPKPRPKPNPAAQAAATAPGSNGSTGSAAKHSIEISLRAAKGSVSTDKAPVDRKAKAG